MFGLDYKSVAVFLANFYRKDSISNPLPLVHARVRRFVAVKSVTPKGVCLAKRRYEHTGIKNQTI